jgi:hypothetical protein
MNTAQTVQTIYVIFTAGIRHKPFSWWVKIQPARLDKVQPASTPVPSQEWKCLRPRRTQQKSEGPEQQCAGPKRSEVRSKDEVL